jgi:hypothetical protein
MKMNNTARLGMLLPTVLNPATAVVGIGLGLIWLLRDDQDDATNEPVKIKRLPPPAQIAAKPLPTVGNLPAKPTATTDAHQLPTVETLPGKIVPEAREAVPAGTLEAAQEEMIRSAMSELGKRSAAARAKKKAEREREETIEVYANVKSVFEGVFWC